MKKIIKKWKKSLKNEKKSQEFGKSREKTKKKLWKNKKKIRKYYLENVPIRKLVFGIRLLRFVSFDKNYILNMSIIWENIFDVLTVNRLTFWSETSLVSLGVKSIHSLIPVTHHCSSPSKAILVHIHWGRFSNWFWIPQRERWRGNQCITWISERIAFVRPSPR